MDLSLDDYFQTKIAKNKAAKPSGILNRLGPKISPVRQRKQNNTQFKVTGVGNIKKGHQQVPPLMRKKVVQQPPPLMRKKVVQQPPPLMRNITVGDARLKLNKNKSQDLRVKVNNLKARNTDAREKIRARQINKSGGIRQINTSGGGAGQLQQQVIVTGLGKPFQGLASPSGVSDVGGMLTKTVKTTTHTTQAGNQRGGRQGIRKTIKGPGSGVGAISVRVTPRNEQQLQQKVDTMSEQPKVRIKNDHYVPPQSQQQRPQRRTQVVQPPQYTAQYPPEPQVVAQPYIPYIPPPQHSHQPIMEPVLQQDIQPSYQPSYVSTSYNASHTGTTFSQPDSGASAYRVIVTNLHPIVTQDDLVELFGSIGALKKARLIKPGMAEVVYMSRDDAMSACKKYHMRELDGQPMQVNMTSLSKVKIPSPEAPPQAPVKTSSPITFAAPRKQKPKKPVKSPSPIAMEEGEAGGQAPLRLGKDNRPGPSNMDMGLVNKALFKTHIPGAPSRPVTFTVKI